MARSSPMERSREGELAVTGGKLWFETLGEGTPVVLLHAGIADHRMWDREFAQLARHHRVVRYDLRGYGRSAVATAPFSAVDDLYQLTRHLDLDRPWLVGCSMGGALAIDYATTHPTSVAGLVLVAPGLSGMTLEQAPEGKDAFDEDDRRSRAAVEAWRRSDVATATEELRQLWCAALDGAALDLFRTMVRENAAEVFDDRSGQHWRPIEPRAAARPGTIKVPTTVLVGDRDNPACGFIATVVTRTIPGSRRVNVPGGDHLLNLSRPAAFDAALDVALGDRR